MNINMQCPINKLGYGVASLNILKSLVKLGHDVALFELGPIEIDKRDVPLIQAARDKQGSFFHKGISLRIYHQNQMASHVGDGIKVGFPIFELENLTQEECHHLSILDRIVVTSQWGKKIILNSDVWPGIPEEIRSSRINVAPLGVDTDIFYPAFTSEEPRWADSSKPTVFLNIGKWEKRKGHDVLIEAFIKAFDVEEKVELWMMCDNPFLTPSQRGQWESMARSHPNIKLIPRVDSHREVADIMRRADCGVFPALAEGWNLEALEILACGKGLIITDATAHTEFCTASNSFLIPHSDEYELAFDGIFFFEQGNWMKWTDKQSTYLISHMRKINDIKKTCVLPTISSSSIDTAKEFTWDRTAKAILSGLPL